MVKTITFAILRFAAVFGAAVVVRPSLDTVVFCFVKKHGGITDAAEPRNRLCAGVQTAELPEMC